MKHKGVGIVGGLLLGDSDCEERHWKASCLGLFVVQHGKDWGVVVERLSGVDVPRRTRSLQLT